MARMKVKTGNWAGQEGEYVRDEGAKVVLLMPAGRAVEFDVENVELVKDEPVSE